MRAAGQIDATGLLGQSNYSTDSQYGGSTISGSNFGNIDSLALDTTNNRLFVSDQAGGRILVFQLNAQNQISGTSASYVLGSCSFATVGGKTATQSTFGGNVVNIIYDPDDQFLLVSDCNHNRVLGFNVAPGTIANCENATFVLGQSSFTAATARLGQEGLYEPDDIDWDATDRLLFYGFQNNRVMAFPIPANPTSAINGEKATFELGQPNFTSSTPVYTDQSGLNDPAGEAWDPNYRRLFVSDYEDNRVMVYSIPSNPTSAINGEDATYVLGEPSFTRPSARMTSRPVYRLPTTVTMIQPTTAFA